MSTFLSKFCDSAQDSRIAPSFSKGDHKVADAFSDFASYADVAEALSSCRIGYSLDDYRIWSDALSLDNHGKENRLTVTLFADGFDGKNDESSMEAYYDEFGVDNFYCNFVITTLGVHIKSKAKWDDLVVDCYVPTASITAGVVSRLVNAICFCHEEHCSLSEALQHLKENVPELHMELQMSVEEIKAQFGEDVGYLGLSGMDSPDKQLVVEASVDTIARIISEVNSGLKLEDREFNAEGGTLCVAAIGMEDALGGNFVVSIPITSKTTLAELRSLVPSGDLQFPSSASDSSERVKDEAQEVSVALKSLEDLFDEHVPSEGMADSLGGELLRAYFRLLYRAENDGDVPLRGYGNITCNSSFRFLNDYFHSLGVKGDFVRYSPFYDEWSIALRNFAPKLLAELMAHDGYLFHIDNTIDSSEVSDEDYDMESADAEDDEDWGDDGWVEDSAGHRCRKCDDGKMSRNFKVGDSSRGGRRSAFVAKSRKGSATKVGDSTDWSYDENTPFHFAVYTKESVLGKPISSISVFVDHDDAGIAHHWIDVENLRGYIPADLLDVLETTSLPDLEDAQELAELIMESYNDFYAKVYGQMHDLVF